MKICIVGAGAIGGFIGTRLAATGTPVSALARGATLQALRQHGWRLHSDDAALRAQAPVAPASTWSPIAPRPRAHRLRATVISR